MLIKTVQGRKQHGTLHRNPFQVHVNAWTFGYLAGQISDPDRVAGQRAGDNDQTSPDTRQNHDNLLSVCEMIYRKQWFSLTDSAFICSAPREEF
ncbi:hypothetical protein [Enterobacter ludwigii]|uniref:hypothetical protein n=1 Tax=Enterobacter ludwigii TaxID=299767 RepID=UPI003F72557E